MEITQSSFIDLLTSFHKQSVKNHHQKDQYDHKRQVFFSKYLQTKNKLPERRLNQQIILDFQSKSMLSNKSRQLQEQNSNESEQQSLQKHTVRTDKYFNCHWLYQSGTFEKSLLYAYFYFAIKTQNDEIFHFLFNKFEQKNAKDHHFKKIQCQKIEYYLTVIVNLIIKKQKHSDKKLLQAYQYFPADFFQYMISVILSQQIQELNPNKINKQELAKISNEIGLGLNYYHVHKRHIFKQLNFQTNSDYFLNIVYIQELKRYMVSDKHLQKPSEDHAREKIRDLIGQNITKLLKKYNQDNQDIFNFQTLQSQQQMPDEQLITMRPKRLTMQETKQKNQEDKTGRGRKISLQIK